MRGQADTVQCTVLNEIKHGGRKAYTKKRIVLPRVDKERRQGRRRKISPLLETRANYDDHGRIIDSRETRTETATLDTSYARNR
jgi:hypothetical protein